VSADLDADMYLAAVINRHRASADDDRPFRVCRRVAGLLRPWRMGGYLESVTISGSHAKSTALRDSDVDVLLSLAPETPGSLMDIHASLAEHFRDYVPRPRNVSLRIQLDGTFDGGAVDLVPGRRRAGVELGSGLHTLWQLREDTWLQTDIAEQIRHVRSAGVLTETLGLKIWRRRHVLRFPSFLLELCTVRAVKETKPISESLLELLEFLSTDFLTCRLLDPGNSNNAVSDVLDREEKLRIAATTEISLRAESWTEVL